MFLKDKRCNLLFAESKGFKTDSKFYLIDFINFEKSMCLLVEILTFQHAQIIPVSVEKSSCLSLSLLFFIKIVVVDKAC